ncbi:3'-5' exonuclease [Paenibacillus lautus]|uniref:3'-5' exonuclease n=1 Tax=Paenibacillus lautus TaxID=1401 RepID=UPI003D29C201
MKIVNISENEYSLTDINIKDIHRQKYCVFDLEATGPNENEDNITQIGAILIDSSGRIEKTFDTLVRPLKPIPEIIERLTGISNRDIEKAPMLSGIRRILVTFVKMQYWLLKRVTNMIGPF